jgi:hypothetical protein
MNERIKLLAEQALKHPDTDNDGLTVFDNDELKKFAELIVNECTKVLFDEAERLFEASSEEFDFRISDDLECCAEQCMDNIVRIEKHFGVE